MDKLYKLSIYNISILLPCHRVSYVTRSGGSDTRNNVPVVIIVLRLPRSEDIDPLPSGAHSELGHGVGIIWYCANQCELD